MCIRDSFNTAHGVTSYGVAASGGSITVCPSSCSPSEPCQCTGLVVGENISINISATNCEFSQEGSSTAILARPRGDHSLQVTIVKKVFDYFHSSITTFGMFWSACIQLINESYCHRFFLD